MENLATSGDIEAEIKVVYGYVESEVYRKVL